MTFKGIIFDLDDTLYDYRILEKKAYIQVEEFALKQLGIERKIFRDSLLKAKKEIKARLPYSASGHNRLLYFQRILEISDYCMLSVAIDLEEVFWSYVLTHMELNKDAEELLDYCKGRKMKIGICTDLTVGIQLKKIKKLGLEKWMDCLVTSEEAGIEKPAMEIFHLCLEKMGLDSEEVIYIGDSYEKDIMGALRTGMKAIWFQDKGERKLPEGCIQAAGFQKIKEGLENGFNTN